MNRVTPFRQLADKQHIGIDVAKYIMAFAVVAIHFRPNFSHDFYYPDIFQWSIMLAVPFYFITSGYLIQSKINLKPTASLKQEYLRYRARKIARLWFIWLAISLPLAIWSYSNRASASFDIVSDVRNYILDVIINGCSPRAAPLWYLYSMFWICLIYRLLINKNKHIGIYLFAVFALIDTAFWAAGHSEIEFFKTFRHYFKSILGGGIYMFAGILIAKQELDNSALYKGIIALSISLALFYLELPYYELAGGTGIFLIAMSLNQLKSHNSSAGLRFQSMWIYYTHEYVLFIVFILIGIKEFVQNPWIILGFIWIIMAALATLLYSLQQTRRFRLLTALVS